MKNKKIVKMRFGIFFLMSILCFCLALNIIDNKFTVIKSIVIPEKKYDKNKLTKKELELLNKIKLDLNEFKKVGAVNIPSNNIFYPTHKSQITERLLEAAMDGTKLEGYAKSFIKVEKNEGINAIYLLAIANHESNFGESRIAKEKYNLFGFNAIDTDPYNKASKFESLDEGIQVIGKKIKNLYLNDKGKYFEGYNSYAMNKNYASDKKWGEKVNNHIELIAKKILKRYN